MKRMITVILILVAIPVLYIGGFILFGTLTKFKPAPIEQVEVVGSNNKPITDSVFTFMTSAMAASARRQIFSTIVARWSLRPRTG